MSYKLSTFLQECTTRIVSETGSCPTSVMTAYANESLRRLRRRYDIPSAEVVTQFALYSGVKIYGLPYEGYKEFVSLQDNYFMNDITFMRNVSENVFWANLQSGNTRSEERNGLTRRLLFNLVNPATAFATLNNCAGDTADGTWVPTNDANTVSTDNLFFRTGSSSLAFNITTALGSAILTNSTMTPKDFSGTAFLNTGMLTGWVYLPSYTAYTGMTLRWGSSATKYWTNSVTTQIDGSAFTTGWNQLGFDWISATAVGSPTSTDAAAIEYMQFSLSYAGTMPNQTGLRLSDFKVQQRRLFNLHSTTEYLVMDSTTNLPKETFVGNDDYFNCDSEFVDYVLYETLEQVFTTHIDSPDSRNYYMTKRMELEQDFMMRYPSKRQPMVEMYMDDSRHDYWIKRGNKQL